MEPSVIASQSVPYLMSAFLTPCSLLSHSLQDFFASHAFSFPFSGRFLIISVLFVIFSLFASLRSLVCSAVRQGGTVALLPVTAAPYGSQEGWKAGMACLPKLGLPCGSHMSSTDTTGIYYAMCPCQTNVLATPWPQPLSETCTASPLTADLVSRIIPVLMNKARNSQLSHIH